MFGGIYREKTSVSRCPVDCTTTETFYGECLYIIITKIFLNGNNIKDVGMVKAKKYTNKIRIIYDI